MLPDHDTLLSAGVDTDPVQAQILAALAALVFYNALELVVLCLATFKRRGSCYFWCLLIASISLIPHSLGFVLLFFCPSVSHYAAATLIIIGWSGTVTGHSLVLWSRLHLVMQNSRVLNGLLTLIIVDIFLLHVPTTVLLYGAVSSHPKPWIDGYGIMERIQLVGFCLQEASISGVYVWETTKMLRLRPEREHHHILAQLLAINVVVLILDFVVVAVQYAGYYALQVMFKPVAYSIKLKLEYAVLGRLVQIASRGSSRSDQEFDTVPSSSDYGPPSRGADCCLEICEPDTFTSRVTSKRPSC